MAHESWHEARLIPTSGINGADEQERRATSALLAVMTAVKEYGRSLTHRLGAPAGSVHSFIEVPFQLGEQTVIPDGLIQVTRGSRSWTALVEVKTGQNELAAGQLENYLDVARENGFDALLTISNEIPPIAGQHPTKVDRRKTKKVALHHLSWTQVLAEAVLQKEFRGVADPDQAWILGELIRYLEHPRSGAMEFEDMGGTWVAVRESVRTGTLRSTDKGVEAVANRFDALLRFASLNLGRQLGTEVTPVLSRKELAEPALRTQSLVTSLATSGTLSGGIRVPSTVGDVYVTADLRANTVTCSVEVDAPREGRPTTRVNWLVRQLKNAPDELRVETRLLHQRGAGPTELLRTVRESPNSITGEGAREIKSFQVALTRPMGTKRGRGRGSFIDSVLDAVDTFYADVVQQIKAWSAAPPRLRTDAEAAEIAAEQPEVAPSLVSTAMSSQDDERAATG
ncbi:hypothetical protein [Cellulomonas wangsupingiae]|uniref:hypothetical protein n=1 Tax=Cellulomonas wangsupingiae TaxID=2968085 RepID=UPI001D0EFF39|nr:hypothetical protein [Cellulomonas wangsupingiae]MCM0638574.1 hypothetical protein [Cellulomonas wangsupingiae]